MPYLTVSAYRAAVVVDVVRTPLGSRDGALSGWHPVDLASEVLLGLIERNDLDPAVVDDVIMGCTVQVGAQALNIGRSAALGAGFPDTVPGVTIDRQCASSQQAVHFAAQGVMAGAYDVVVAGGVELMSLVPMGAATSVPGVGLPYGRRVLDRYGLVPQGVSAEVVAERSGVGRSALDAVAARSHLLAAAARAAGHFEHEIMPVVVRRRRAEPLDGSQAEADAGSSGPVVEDVLQADECISDLDAASLSSSLSQLKPVFEAQGSVTAGNSSQIADGAAALLIMSEDRARSLGCVPRARLHSFAVVGVDPVITLTGVITATHQVLDRAGLRIDDIALVEVHEAFASVVLAWQADLHADMAKVNASGGAIALGNPIGCTGARMTATLVNALERTRGRYGLQVVSGGGGMANAMILERLG